MGALGEPCLGKPFLCTSRLGKCLRAGPARALWLCAATLVGLAAVMAQSTEITKTTPQQRPGQTEIRKSQPGAGQRAPGHLEPAQARPAEAREAATQRATMLPTLEWPTDASGQAVTVT